MIFIFYSILETVISIGIVTIMFLLIVAIHEFGHMFTAKLFGVKVYKYAIGMGKPIFKRNWGGIEFSLRWLLIGGFVLLAGQLPDFINGRPIWILSNDKNEILYFGLKKRIININKKLNLELTPIKIIPKSEESMDGKVVTKNNELYFITSQTQLISMNESFPVTTYEEKLFTKPLWQQWIVLLTGCVLNFVFGLFLFWLYTIFHLHVSLEKSIYISLVVFWRVFHETIIVLGNIFTNFSSTVNNLSGAIMVVASVHHVVVATPNIGSLIWELVVFTGIVSISVGVMNLIPIAPLDGFLVLRSMISKIVNIPFAIFAGFQLVGILVILGFVIFVNVQNAITLIK